MTTFALQIDWNADRTWTDETARLHHVHLRIGFAEAHDPVAAVGRCALTLANGDRRFSPGYSAGPLYGSLLPRRAVRLQASSGENVWTLFRGFIEAIRPEPGPQSGGECLIECVDGLALLEKQAVGVAHASSMAVDEAVGEIVGLAYTPPAVSISDNGLSLEHYGESWHPEHTTCRDALADICQAVYGRFFVQRDGTATFWSKDDLQNPSTAPALILDDHDLAGLALALGVHDVVNAVKVTIYPVEMVGSPQELWRSRTVLRLAPGQTRVIHALFRDENGARCGAEEVITPAATTDYRVFDNPGGTGFEYTTEPAFSISTQTEATRMQITLSNSAIGPLYVTLLRVRGRPIRTYDPITVEHGDSASQSAYQKRALALDLRLQRDPVFAEAMAHYLVGRGKDPNLHAERLQSRRGDTLAGANLFAIDLMDKIVISDSQSGLDAAGHWIRALEYDLGGAALAVTLHLERADDRRYWLLGKAGYSELGQTTRAGF